MWASTSKLNAYETTAPAPVPSSLALRTSSDQPQAGGRRPHTRPDILPSGTWNTRAASWLKTRRGKPYARMGSHELATSLAPGMCVL